jgi:hypothetical protein
MTGRTTSLLLAAALVAAFSTRAPAIHDQIGTACGTCQFPTAVRMPLCSGVYMGHGLVITAAHCVNDVSEGQSRAYFGESDGDDAAFSAVITSCVAHPDGEPTSDGYEGVDLAFCTLDDADGLPDIPIVPAMIPTGCERDWLAHQVYELGTPPLVTVVGSGCPDHYGNGNSCGVDGVKRYLPLQLVRQTTHDGSPTKLELERWGDLETGVLDGDSGGPVFDVMPDGTWRLIGVVHSTNVALEAAFAEAVPPYLHWIEAESGIDLTPCHEFENGAWVKHGDCAGLLPKDANEAGASWSDGCPSAMGGGSGLAANYCPGWPSSPGDKPLTTATTPALRPELFLEAAKLVLQAPYDGRPEQVSADFTPLSVFPFLAGELPGSLQLSYLTDPAKLRQVERMIPARR